MESTVNFMGIWASPGGNTWFSHPLIAPGTVLEYPLALGPFKLSWTAIVSQFLRDEKIVLRSTCGPIDARTTVSWEPAPDKPEHSHITLSVSGRPTRTWNHVPAIPPLVTKRYLNATGKRLVKHFGEYA